MYIGLFNAIIIFLLRKDKKTVLFLQNHIIKSYILCQYKKLRL